LLTGIQKSEGFAPMKGSSRNSGANGLQGSKPRPEVPRTAKSRKKESRRTLLVLRPADIEVIRLGPALFATIKKTKAPLR
jgi:hypothetical protein